MKLKIKKLFKNAKLPEKMTEEAAAYDVYCHRVEEKDNGLYICYLGLAMTPPEGFFIRLQPRSSATKYPMFMGNSPAVGDGDFVGEYQVRFRMLSGYDFPYKAGDRIAQMNLEEIIPIDIEVVYELKNSFRGQGGFGSTDKQNEASPQERVFWEDQWNNLKTIENKNDTSK